MRNHARLLAMLCAAVTLLAGGVAEAATTVILVRHAEKQTTPDMPDPSLNDAGAARAAALARVLADAPLEAVFVTQFKRTQETGAPTAAAHGLEAAPRDAGDVAGVAAEILREHEDETVLVCGHSNTVPAMIRSLGVDTDLTLTEQDYDDLFVVTIDDGGNATLLHLHYGAPSE
jgi:broad specificity phosphatase PhoE